MRTNPSGRTQLNASCRCVPKIRVPKIRAPSVEGARCGLVIRRADQYQIRHDELRCRNNGIGQRPEPDVVSAGIERKIRAEGWMCSRAIDVCECADEPDRRVGHVTRSHE